MCYTRIKLIDDELDILKKNKVPFNIEHGTKHIKIYVNGKMVGITPIKKPSERELTSAYNVRSQIRREAKLYQA